MAFQSTSLYQVRPGSLTNGEGAEWRYETTDSTGTVFGTGYFAAVMRGSRGLSGRGVSTGDIVHTIHGSSAMTVAGLGRRRRQQHRTAARRQNRSFHRRHLRNKNYRTVIL